MALNPGATGFLASLAQNTANRPNLLSQVISDASRVSQNIRAELGQQEDSYFKKQELEMRQKQAEQMERLREEQISVEKQQLLNQKQQLENAKLTTQMKALEQKGTLALAQSLAPELMKMEGGEPYAKALLAGADPQKALSFYNKGVERRIAAEDKGADPLSIQQQAAMSMLNVFGFDEVTDTSFRTQIASVTKPSEIQTIYSQMRTADLKQREENKKRAEDAAVNSFVQQLDTANQLSNPAAKLQANKTITANLNKETPAVQQKVGTILNARNSQAEYLRTNLTSGTPSYGEETAIKLAVDNADLSTKTAELEAIKKNDYDRYEKTRDEERAKSFDYIADISAAAQQLSASGRSSETIEKFISTAMKIPATQAAIQLNTDSGHWWNDPSLTPAFVRAWNDMATNVQNTLDLTYRNENVPAEEAKIRAKIQADSLRAVLPFSSPRPGAGESETSATRASALLNGVTQAANHEAKGILSRISIGLGEVTGKIASEAYGLTSAFLEDTSRGTFYLSALLNNLYYGVQYPEISAQLQTAAEEKFLKETAMGTLVPQVTAAAIVKLGSSLGAFPTQDMQAILEEEKKTGKVAPILSSCLATAGVLKGIGAVGTLGAGAARLAGLGKGGQTVAAGALALGSMAVAPVIVNEAQMERAGTPQSMAALAVDFGINVAKSGLFLVGLMAAGKIGGTLTDRVLRETVRRNPSLAGAAANATIVGQKATEGAVMAVIHEWQAASQEKRDMDYTTLAGLALGNTLALAAFAPWSNYKFEPGVAREIHPSTMRQSSGLKEVPSFPPEVELPPDRTLPPEFMKPVKDPWALTVVPSRSRGNIPVTYPSGPAIKLGYTAPASPRDLYETRISRSVAEAGRRVEGRALEAKQRAEIDSLYNKAVKDRGKEFADAILPAIVEDVTRGPSIKQEISNMASPDPVELPGAENLPHVISARKSAAVSVAETSAAPEVEGARLAFEADLKNQTAYVKVLQAGEKPSSPDMLSFEIIPRALTKQKITTKFPVGSIGETVVNAVRKTADVLGLPEIGVLEVLADNNPGSGRQTDRITDTVHKYFKSRKIKGKTVRGIAETILENESMVNLTNQIDKPISAFDGDFSIGKDTIANIAKFTGESVDTVQQKLRDLFHNKKHFPERVETGIDVLIRDRAASGKSLVKADIFKAIVDEASKNGLEFTPEDLNDAKAVVVLMGDAGVSDPTFSSYASRRFLNKRLPTEKTVLTPQERQRIKILDRMEKSTELSDGDVSELLSTFTDQQGSVSPRGLDEFLNETEFRRKGMGLGAGARKGQAGQFRFDLGDIGVRQYFSRISRWIHDNILSGSSAVGDFARMTWKVTADFFRSIARTPELAFRHMKKKVVNLFQKAGTEDAQAKAEAFIDAYAEFSGLSTLDRGRSANARAALRSAVKQLGIDFNDFTDYDTAQILNVLSSREGGIPGVKAPLALKVIRGNKKIHNICLGYGDIFEFEAEGKAYQRNLQQLINFADGVGDFYDIAKVDELLKTIKHIPKVHEGKFAVDPNLGRELYEGLSAPAQRLVNAIDGVLLGFEFEGQAVTFNRAAMKKATDIGRSYKNISTEMRNRGIELRQTALTVEDALTKQLLEKKAEVYFELSDLNDQYGGLQGYVSYGRFKEGTVRKTPQGAMADRLSRIKSNRLRGVNLSESHIKSQSNLIKRYGFAVETKTTTRTTDAKGNILKHPVEETEYIKKTRASEIDPAYTETDIKEVVGALEEYYKGVSTYVDKKLIEHFFRKVSVSQETMNEVVKNYGCDEGSVNDGLVVLEGDVWKRFTVAGKSHFLPEEFHYLLPRERAQIEAGEALMGTQSWASRFGVVAINNYISYALAGPTSFAKDLFGNMFQAGILVPASATQRRMQTLNALKKAGKINAENFPSLFSVVSEVVQDWFGTGLVKNFMYDARQKITGKTNPLKERFAVLTEAFGSASYKDLHKQAAMGSDDPNAILRFNSKTADAVLELRNAVTDRPFIHSEAIEAGIGAMRAAYRAYLSTNPDKPMSMKAFEEHYYTHQLIRDFGPDYDSILRKDGKIMLEQGLRNVAKELGDAVTRSNDVTVSFNREQATRFNKFLRDNPGWRMIVSFMTWAGQTTARAISSMETLITEKDLSARDKFRHRSIVSSTAVMAVAAAFEYYRRKKQAEIRKLYGEPAAKKTTLEKITDTTSYPGVVQGMGSAAAEVVMGNFMDAAVSIPLALMQGGRGPLVDVLNVISAKSESRPRLARMMIPKFFGVYGRLYDETMKLLFPAKSKKKVKVAPRRASKSSSLLPGKGKGNENSLLP